MAQRDELEEIAFRIPAFTPDTIPLPRLLEYLAQIAAVMGDDLAREMHLIRVQRSSAKPVFKVLPDTARRVREQSVRVRTGQGTQKQKLAYRRVREMVLSDGGKPATLADRTGVLIDFQPLQIETDLIAAVRQHTTYDGKLIRVGGQTEDSTVLMESLSGDVQSNFVAPRATAKRMAKFLFEPIRVIGPGTWNRYRDGRWVLESMRIADFEPLEDDSLSEVFQKLRDTNVAWPENAEDAIRAERESA